MQITSNPHPFLVFALEDQKELMNDVWTEFKKKKVSKADFGKNLKSALCLMKSPATNSDIPQEVTDVLTALNAEAEKRLCQRFVEGWKKQLPMIEVLTNFLPKTGMPLAVCAGTATGLTLFYIQSHPLFAVASSCMACAFLILRSGCATLKGAYEKQSRVIQDLKRETVPQFSTNMDRVCSEIKKSSYLFRLNFHLHEGKLGSKDHNLQLLKEQLDALHHLINLITRFFIDIPETFSSTTPVEPLDLNQIHLFFEKFGKFCRKGLMGVLGLGILALAWTYYAYVQKAYLMTIAGMVCLIGASIVSHQFFVLEKGSKKISAVKTEGEMVTAYHQMASSVLLLRLANLNCMSGHEIQKAIVIPFDSILKLIPAWKG